MAIYEGVATLTDILELRNSNRSSLLHFACNNWGTGSTEAAVSQILHLGFDVDVLDSWGQSPLSAFMAGSSRGSKEMDWVIRAQKVVVFLLNAGADPHLINNLSVSISELVYTDQGSKYGSYQGDLWDSALSLCGHDPLVFRSKVQRRRAQYAKYYTRRDFEKLWSGREHLCPYWDDAPWPALRDWVANRKDGRGSTNSTSQLASDNEDESPGPRGGYGFDSEDDNQGQVYTCSDGSNPEESMSEGDSDDQEDSSSS